MIEIEDNGTYNLPAAGLVRRAAAGAELVIQARNGMRPTAARRHARERARRGARSTLDGFLLVRDAARSPGSWSGSTLRHCTLVPGVGLDADGGPPARGADA